MPLRAAVIVVLLVVLITAWATNVRRRKGDTALVARTRALQTYAQYVQATTEQVRSEVARELHDELGGLFVVSKMDIDWITRQLPDADEALKAKLTQLSSSLDAGLAIERRLVERLHPSILDHLGIYAALQWQLKESCTAVGVAAVSRVPDDGPTLPATAAIIVFRVGQDAIARALAAKDVSRIELDAGIVAGAFELTIADNGRAPGPAHELLAWSVSQRAGSFGGTSVIEDRPDGSSRVVVRIPVTRLMNA
jgi:signal transduction histidine kinase